MSELNPHTLFSDHSPAEPAASGDMLAAREVALRLMEAVMGQKQALDHVLEGEPRFKALPSRDRAFCRMLVSTCLRRLGQVDDLIRQTQEREAPRNLTLLNILRLGVTQILFMNVPDHAAVDTAVRLTDAAGMERQKGFVNAVLRNLARSGRELVTRQDEGRLNTPEWLLRLWIGDYDLRTAAQIAKAHLTEAPMDITIKNEKDRNYWGSALKATELGTAGTLRCQLGGPVQEYPGYDDGMWWVQDASAAIPASLFGDITGKTVVDLCAAPGGKTMQLAARGAHVIALDRSAQRLQRLQQNLARLRLEDHVTVEASDATVWQPREAPEFILLDAPCTATGTIRRHPDVLHLKTPRDLERLAALQEQVLLHAFDILKPGGVLVYCTCSLQKAEGEHQVQTLIEARDNALKLAITPKELGDWDEAITPDGDLRILPFHRAATGGMDGFFISRITKSA